MEYEKDSRVARLERYRRRKILYEDGDLSKYPTHMLKRVDKPTNLISENVQRVDPREGAINRAARGDFGEKIKSGAWRIVRVYPVNCAIADVLALIASIDVGEVAGKAPIPEDPHVMSRHIKSLAYFFGADIVGIGPVPEYAYFSCDYEGNPVDLDYKYAIVILNKKNYDILSASYNTDWINEPIGFQAYLMNCLVAELLSNYIRRLGYPAMTQYDGYDLSGHAKWDINFMPLLLWSGLGEVSRAFMVLNPFLGLGYKVGAVLTNMPLEIDKPIDFGLQDFCQHCHICADSCPFKAIPYGDKVMYNGYEQWRLDTQRCVSQGMLNKYGTVCNICTKACPWTRPSNWRNNLVRRAVSGSSIARKIATKFDSMRGRHKAKGNEARQWWFDLEYDKEGYLHLPSEMPPGKHG
jgi:reductive dehalogenase